MRAEPSAADLGLMERLRDEHAESRERFEISQTKLERWRSLELLPTATVERPRFGGSRVAAHNDEVLGAARLLGRVSRQGRPWPLTAEELFNARFPLGDKALRGAADYLMRAETRNMERAWAHATKEAAPTGDLIETAAEIGERAAAQLPRDLKAVVRNEMALAHGPAVSDAQIREYADRALTWRMVDFAMPAHQRSKLSESERNLARHGVEEHVLGLGGVGVLPLPSERSLVAATLTWEEARIYREFATLRATENPALTSLGLFKVTTWVVASERLNVPPHNLEVAVSETHLDVIREMLTAPDR